MVTCQSSELGWEVTVELLADFLSLGRGSVNCYRKEVRFCGPDRGCVLWVTKDTT